MSGHDGDRYSITVHFRFYEELNDFLPPERRKIEFVHQVTPDASIKDVIESLGVPHTEIDLILVNGESVDFSYQVQPDDYVSVYPVFESMDISPVTRLRPEPLRMVRFILDVHLGKLARYLRLLGFDTYYDTRYNDDEIIQMALQQHRIILTRDIGLLKNRIVTHGYWLRNTNPKAQIIEILDRFDLAKKSRPFTRCLECNGQIALIDMKDDLKSHIPSGVKEIQNEFYQCENCKRVYWQGTHYSKLNKLVQEFLGAD
jgi:uncharacterized protein with PIN domain